MPLASIFSSAGPFEFVISMLNIWCTHFDDRNLSHFEERTNNAAAIATTTTATAVGLANVYMFGGHAPTLSEIYKITFKMCSTSHLTQTACIGTHGTMEHDEHTLPYRYYSQTDFRKTIKKNSREKV